MCNCPALGIIFVWYKRKATLSSSTMGNLVELVPSLASNTPSLDTLSPMLSELASSRTKSRTTPATTSHQTTSDELITPPVLVWRLQAAPATPSTSTAQQSLQLDRGPNNRNQRSRYMSEGGATEPVSLEIFNKAATDLETKGMINLRRYSKYLTKKISKPVWTLCHKELLIIIYY